MYFYGIGDELKDPINGPVESSKLCRTMLSGLTRDLKSRRE